ncbi:MAG: universal stress protein [Halobacteriaceae archaeon]
MYDRVLLGVDGSQCATTAARVGLALAAATGAAVDVVSAVTETDDPTRERADRDRARAALDEVGELSATVGVPVETHVREGRPADALATTAAERSADLVVVGRTGTGGVGRRLLGSVTDRLLRTVDRDVLVVPDDLVLGDGWAADTVLAPTDGSEAAERAAAPAAGVADALGATLAVLGVVDLQAEAGMFSAGGVSEEFVEHQEARRREDVEAFLAAARRTAAPTTRTAVRRGRPHEEIAAHAEAVGAGLVVMASRGESTFAGQLLGSVTDRVIRLAGVPVLVVPVR